MGLVPGGQRGVLRNVPSEPLFAVLLPSPHCHLQGDTIQHTADAHWTTDGAGICSLLSCAGHGAQARSPRAPGTRCGSSFGFIAEPAAILGLRRVP